MARILITGSADGLGSLTAQRLIASGHQVVLHARNSNRMRDAEAACPGATAVLVADLTSMDETRQLAFNADKHGPFDAVIHNAGLYVGAERIQGKSGLPSLFAVNTLAPYMLTCLMSRPKRLLFVSSGMHSSGRPNLDALPASRYGDSKLHAVLLANAFARLWPDVQSNSADPGWVPTRMGGSGAPGKTEDAVDTFVMAALGDGDANGKTGTYFYNSRVSQPSKIVSDIEVQDRLLEELEKISGVAVPGRETP